MTAQQEAKASAPDIAGGNPSDNPSSIQNAHAEAVPSQGSPASGGKPGKPSGNDKVSRMGTASLPRLLTEFAIPAIIGMLVNAAYNLIDSIFLGQAMGEIGLSAVTVASPLMIVFMALAMLVGNGGNALAALRLGEGRKDDAETSLGNTVTLAIALWIIVAVIASVPALLDAFLTFSSATDEVRPYAASFIRILSLGFGLQIIGMGVNNFIRTAGAPNRALVTMVIGAVVCTIFNYLFVLKLGWGVEGSALATLVGQAASCVSVLWFFVFTKNAPLKLHIHCMRPHAKIIRSILSLGLASFAVQAGAAVVNFAINFLLVKYGSVSAVGAEGALASIGVVQRIAMFTVMPLIGVSVALQPLLGFNYGAKKIARVRKALWLGVAFATSLAVIMWAAVHLFPGPIVNLFGITNPDLPDFTIFALKVQLLMLPLVGFQIVGSNYFQATGQPAKSTILSLTRQVLFLLPLMFWLPEVLPTWFSQFTGLDALYIATPVADFLSIFVTAVFIAVEMRRLGKVERGEVTANY